MSMQTSESISRLTSDKCQCSNPLSWIHGWFSLTSQQALHSGRRLCPKVHRRWPPRGMERHVIVGVEINYCVSNIYVLGITVADHNNSMNVLACIHIVNQTMSVEVTACCNVDFTPEKLSTLRSIWRWRWRWMLRSACRAHGRGDEYWDMVAHGARLGASLTQASLGWSRIRFEEWLWGFVHRNREKAIEADGRGVCPLVGRGGDVIVNSPLIIVRAITTMAPTTLPCLFHVVMLPGPPLHRAFRTNQSHHRAHLCIVIACRWPRRHQICVGPQLPCTS